MTRPLLPKPIGYALVALAAVRFASVTRAATGRTRGDFYASMPGAYVETLNPVLWNSPDMVGAWGFHKDTYFHGPTQYLTLYPFALIDSFTRIAAVLLPLYALAIGLTFWILWRIGRRLGATQEVFVPMLVSTFLFFPLLQAYVQREFEIVMMLLMAGALLLLVRNRTSQAAAVLAYAAWFKYIPLMFVGYFGLRRWFAALATFVGVSAIVLAASQLLFGLPRFFNNNVPGHAAQVFAVFDTSFTFEQGQLWGHGFCEGWFDNEATLTNIRHGLCSIAAYHPWLPPHLVYLAICIAVATLYLHTHFRLERIPLAAVSEARRRAIECSIITTICACFFFSHYYYLAVLIIPFNVLLAIYLADRRFGAMALWAVSYFLVSAFVVPVSILNRIAGFDVWEPFVWQAWFLWGEFLLIGLLLHEYRQLGSGSKGFQTVPEVPTVPEAPWNPGTSGTSGTVLSRPDAV